MTATTLLNSKYSLFKIGLVLVVVGSIWIWITFSGSEKISYTIRLDPKEIFTQSLDLTKKGYGYYTILMPDYSSQKVSVQIFNPHGDIISDKEISTKMSVNYFEFDYGGKYSLKITNLSEKSVSVDLDFGNLREPELKIPMIISFSGMGLIIFSAYRRLSNHRTAHPEENIS